MALQMDPAGAEIRALAGATHWQTKKVIEIGCGDGRLTLRLAALGPAHIEALDPDPDSIKLARKNLPPDEKGRIRYRVGQAGALKYPADTFDIAVFSWVL
jgi:ubiquinone/menaquinone biosynthesis C-methylase UbiE